MNYLAHAYLSFNHKEILVGNMISDYVKGRKKFDYPESVQNGIYLHRCIDEYTDKHPSTIALKEFFRPAYRLYAGAFVDIVYDYFLANDPNEFIDADSLQHFCETTYQSMDEHFLLFPAVFQRAFINMKTQNWLYNYRYLWGIEKSFGGLARRAMYITEIESARIVFEDNLEQMQPYYDSFFSSLKSYAHEIIHKFTHDNC